MSEASALPKEVVEDLKAKYPDDILHVVPTACGPVVLKEPAKAVLKRYLDSKESAVRAAEVFALDCAVHPERQVLESYFAKKALLGALLAGKLKEWATGAVEAEDSFL
jgi:hypothetical protein